MLIPSSVMLTALFGSPLTVELRAVPDELVSRVPQTQGYEYAVASNRVLLVSPPTRIVVGVFPSVKELEGGAGLKQP